MLRFKIIVIIVSGVLLLTGTLYGVSKILILGSYKEIETVQALRNLTRTENSIASISDGLNVKLRDWATWDDSYQFVQDTNETFIESNLANQTLSNLEINFIVYINVNGEIIFSKFVDIASGETLQPDTMLGELTKLFSTFICTEATQKTGGLIESEQKLLFIEGLPILQSTGEGPVMGTVLFGRYANEDLIQSLRDLTQLDLSLYLYNSGALPKETVRAKEMLTSSSDPYYIAPLSKDTVAGYFILNDIDNLPVALVSISSPREIFTQGTKTHFLFTLMTGVAIFVFGITMLILIERVLLRRFGKLTKEVGAISVQNLLGAQVSISSKDEVGQLGTMINRMLNELSKLQKQEREVQSLQVTASTKLKKSFEEITKMNRLMVDREIKMIELKEKIAKLEAELLKQKP